MAFVDPIAVEGLADLRRDLRRMDKQLLVGFRETLKDAAQIVAREAVSRAPRRTGRLVASIKPRVRGDVASVVVTARARDGYPYPRRIEFERGGQRAFLAPALEAKRRRVEERMEGLLDDIGDYWRQSGD